MLKWTNNSNDSDTKTDRYLITYADLITLLLGLFVILYASAQVDEAKYKEFSAAFSEYFKPGQTLEGGSGVLEGSRQGLPEPILPPSSKSFEAIASEVESRLKDYIEQGELRVQKIDDGIVLTLSEKLLFQSSKAEIQEGAFAALDTLANILQGVDYQISIDGHTDSDPIRTFRYESNWHLSVARALNVGYYLIQHGLPEVNTNIRGFGAQRPVVGNETPDGKAMNRRVEITLRKLSEADPSTAGYEKQDSAGGQNFE
ncbi:MAG: flagellar motor protein MotB [Candidatus Kapaibacterium sp.]